mmetsp:Transcript_46019/g.127807  ORF Transcript_46019/g.127807 Transcript_46019/m.127807 type:complete len:216 (-) Transcript_46019:320-967(-)
MEPMLAGLASSVVSNAALGTLPAQTALWTRLAPPVAAHGEPLPARMVASTVPRAPQLEPLLAGAALSAPAPMDVGPRGSMPAWMSPSTAPSTRIVPPGVAPGVMLSQRIAPAAAQALPAASQRLPIPKTAASRRRRPRWLRPFCKSHSKLPQALEGATRRQLRRPTGTANLSRCLVAQLLQSPAGSSNPCARSCGRARPRARTWRAASTHRSCCP